MKNTLHTCFEVMSISNVLWRKLRRLLSTLSTEILLEYW